MMSEKTFLKELKTCIYDTSNLEQFMDEVENHPQHAWQKALLFLSHGESSTIMFHDHIDPTIVNNFINELVDKFPDVLQRVLLRGAYGQNHERMFGALHIAIICDQKKIVELLTRVEFKSRIKDCLIEYVKSSIDESKAIERALLWSYLKESSQDASKSQLIARFFNEFKAAKRSGNSRLLDNLIAHASLYPLDAWRTTLLWASACGETHIVRKFKDEWSELFANIQESSQIDGFSTLRISSSASSSAIKGKENVKIKQEIYDLVSDLVDLADQPYYRELMAKNLHSRIGEGWIPLHIATILRDGTMLDLLIDCYDHHHTWGKIADKLNSYRNFDLTRAHQQKHGQHYQIEYSYHDFADDSWMTPLHYAIIGEDHNIVRKLLNWETYKPHLNAFNLFMCTSFQTASSLNERGSTMLQILMENRFIDVNVEDCCSFSPLHWAVYVGAADSIRFLLSRAEDIDRPIKMSGEDIEGRQAFAIAVENDTWKLLTSLPEVKQEVERLYRDRQVYVDAANAILVGAALIAGVTFGGWLSPPVDTPANVHYVRVYWAFNSLSFFFSVAAVMAGAAAVLPMEDVYIGKAVKAIREWLMLTSFLLVISVIFVLGAFTSAGFASLDSSEVSSLKTNMLITSCIGCFVCGVVGLSFLLKLFAICQAWSYKYFLRFIQYGTRTYRCMQRAIRNPLLPSALGYKIEMDIKQDLNIVGRKWKGKEANYKRLRGIHHVGQISMSACRRYALHNQRTTHDRLLVECNRLQEIGIKIAEEYVDIDWGSWTQKDDNPQTEMLQSSMY